MSCACRSLRTRCRLTQNAHVARLATSRLCRVRRARFGLSKHVIRPSRPALGHPRNRKQPLDLVAIAEVDASYIPDGEIMIGSLDYPDLVPGAYIALDDYSQVRPGAQRLGEAARKRLVVHPNAKPPAGDSRLGNLEKRGPNLPLLADERIAHLDSFRREIFAKLTVVQRSADLLFPPPYVLDGVCVDRLIGPPMGGAIRLVVSGKVDTSDCDPAGDR
jgi:hypothetical protein